MEDLHSCVIRDETSQCKKPTAGLGENFEDLLTQHREYDKVAEEMELEVKYEKAKEEVEVINSIKGQTSREEFSNRENEEEVVLQPIKNVNRVARAAAVKLLGLPPEDDDDDDSRNWWEPKEKPFKVARGPPSTALKRFQDRFKKWLGLK